MANSRWGKVPNSYHRGRNARLADSEIPHIPADEFDGLEYTQEELELVHQLVSQVPASGKTVLDESPVGIMLSAALPPLTTEEERILFRRMNFIRSQAEAIHLQVGGRRNGNMKHRKIEVLLSEADNVRSRLANSYVRLVVAVARKFSKQSQDFQDLVGEGMLILLSALDKFDYSRGFRFSTYLTHSLQRQFSRVLKRMQRSDARYISTPDHILVDMIPADEETYIETAPALAVNRLMDAAQHCLEEREHSILNRRYGTGSQVKQQTLRQIAAEFGMSKERVRQIQVKALAKLKGLAMELKLVSAVS